MNPVARSHHFHVLALVTSCSWVEFEWSNYSWRIYEKKWTIQNINILYWCAPSTWHSWLCTYYQLLVISQKHSKKISHTRLPPPLCDKDIFVQLGDSRDRPGPLHHDLAPCCLDCYAQPYHELPACDWTLRSWNRNTLGSRSCYYNVYNVKLRRPLVLLLCEEMCRIVKKHEPMSLVFQNSSRLLSE